MMIITTSPRVSSLHRAEASGTEVIALVHTTLEIPAARGASHVPGVMNDDPKPHKQPCTIGADVVELQHPSL